MSPAMNTRPLRKRLLAAFRDEAGNATVNFVIIFPFFIALVFSVFEAGWLMTRAMMLERGVDIAARAVRLGLDPTLTHEDLKDVVCEHSMILMNCDRDLVLELVEMDLDKDYPQNDPNCTDRTGAIEPVISFTPGGRERIMFIRACMVIDPIMPGMGLGLTLPKDSSGGFQLVSYAAFMNEPV